MERIAKGLFLFLLLVTIISAFPQSSIFAQGVDEELQDQLAGSNDGCGGLNEIPCTGTERIPSDLKAFNPWGNSLGGKILNLVFDPVKKLMGVVMNPLLNTGKKTVENLYDDNGLEGVCEEGYFVSKGVCTDKETAKYNAMSGRSPNSFYSGIARNSNVLGATSNDFNDLGTSVIDKNACELYLITHPLTFEIFNAQQCAKCSNISTAKEQKHCYDCLTNADGDGYGTWTALGCIRADLKKFISENVFGTLLGLAGVFALLCIIYNAIQLQISAGNPEKIKRAQELLTSCIAGLILILFSVFFLQLVGSSVLRIPFNLI